VKRQSNHKDKEKSGCQLVVPAPSERSKPLIAHKGSLILSFTPTCDLITEILEEIKAVLYFEGKHNIL